jgi:hypothetical protein
VYNSGAPQAWVLANRNTLIAAKRSPTFPFPLQEVVVAVVCFRESAMMVVVVVVCFREIATMMPQLLLA